MLKCLIVEVILFLIVEFLLFSDCRYFWFSELGCELIVWIILVRTYMDILVLMLSHNFVCLVYSLSDCCLKRVFEFEFLVVWVVNKSWRFFSVQRLESFLLWKPCLYFLALKFVFGHMRIEATFLVVLIILILIGIAVLITGLSSALFIKLEILWSGLCCFIVRRINWTLRLFS